MTTRIPTIARGILLSAAISLSVLLVSAPSRASTAWGSINNFDTVNDTGGDCHGFEIELDDIHSKDITYTYDWNHYGVPIITEDNTDPFHPKVFVRYAAKRNPDGTWTAFTSVPAGPISPTDGHQFTNPSVNFGGEHFGVGFLGAPTAIKYNWLKDDGAGNLIFAGAVNIATPSFTYVPPAPAVPPQVIAVIEPPPPPEVPVMEFGPASWVKETRTQTHNNRKVELRDLVSDDPNDPNDRNWKNGEPDEVEVEWQVMQTDFNAGDGGAKGKMEGAPEPLENGDEVITRRYDFYKYVGPLDPETGEALAENVGPDGIHGTGAYAGVVVVGDYVGAQMAGFDAGAQIGLIDHLQDGEKNVAYVERTIVVGGTAPIITTRDGALPQGMVFDEVTGILSGTPTEAGTFTFTIHSTDGAAGDVSTTYHLTITDGIVQPPHITVTVMASPPAGGAVLGGGEYEVGAPVTVTATANPGFAFLNWTDGGTIVSDLPQFDFVADVNRELVANFAAVITITATASPAEGGIVTGTGNYNAGETAKLWAITAPGYNFLNWTEGGVVVSTSDVYTFVTEGSRTLVANFVKAIPTYITMGNFSGQPGRALTLAATLYDKASNVVLPGKNLMFAIDGVTLSASVMTDATGKAKFALVVPDDYPLGTHSVSVVFTGVAAYGWSSKVSTLTVNKGSVKLTVSTVYGSAGNLVTLTGKITNAAGVPLPGMTLAFAVGGVAAGSGVTDGTGTAKVTYTIPAGTAKGYYPRTVTFAGDATHLGAAKSGWLVVR